MWNTIFFEPLLNALVWLVNIMPGGSIALAVIVMTVVIKLLLSPLQARAIRSQILQKKLQPEVTKIREQYKDPREQSQKLMALYRERKASPFSGCLPMLIQLPIILALYQVFLRGLEFDPEFLYKAIQVPETITRTFFTLDLTESSIIFAALAAIAQFLQLWFSPAMQNNEVSNNKEVSTDAHKKPSFAEHLGKNMQKQMKFMMPVLIFVFGMAIPAAVCLYWVVNNIFTLLQEIIIRRRLADKV